MAPKKTKIASLILVLVMLVATVFALTISVSADGEQIHNFTDDGFTSGFFTFKGGQITNGKHGTYTHDFGSGTETLNDALKFDSSGSVTFTPNADGTVTIAVAAADTGRKVVINNGSSDIGTVSIDTANKLFVLTVDVTANVTYTVKRSSGESGLYYIAYVPAASAPACEHTNKTTATVPATCTEAGSTTVTCDDCGETVSTEEIAALGHNYVDGACSVCGDADPAVCTHGNVTSVVTAPTCTAGGYTTNTCDDCGNVSTSDEVAALGHTAGAAATCTTAQTCTVCSAELEKALGHSYGEAVETTAPTCTEAGETTATCSACGDTKTETVKALGHNYIEGFCSRCGEEEPEINPYEHNFTENGNDSSFYTITGNLSTSKGTVNYNSLTLTQCLKIESSTNISFTAPSAGTLTLVFVEASPNIKVDGTKVTGSDGVITVEVSGTHTITKADTMNLFYMLYAPSHTHSYEAVVTAPTCEADGYTTHTCSCGDSYTDSVVTALGHNYVDNVCTTCGETDPNACVHNYVAVVTAPTCTEGGYTTHTCDSCGDSYVTDEVEALGHTAGPVATCTAPQTCTACGTELSPQLDHNYVGEVTTAPSCGTAGVKTYTCSSCGDSYTEEIAVVGHVYIDHRCSCGALEGIINFSDWEDYATGKYEAGEIQQYDKYFTFIHNTGSRVDDNEKTFADGFATLNRFNFGGKTDTGKVPAKSALKITVTEKTTIRLWWVSGGDGRLPVLLDSNGAEIALTLESVKDGMYITDLEIPAAGTYYLGNKTGNNYWFKIAMPELCDHTKTNTVVDVTCTEAGTSKVFCSDCGTLISSEDVDALGHTEVVDAAVAPTCTTAGKTEGSHCSVCNEVLVAQEEVAATGHTYQAETIEPTCTEAGSTTYTCACGDSYTEEIAKLAHSYNGEGVCSCGDVALIAVDKEGNETYIENIYFTFDGASLRYSIDGETYNKTNCVDMRFSYNFADDLELTGWGWSYKLGAQEIASAVGNYKTADNLTNLVFTNVHFVNFEFNVQVQIWFELEIEGETYTVYENGYNVRTAYDVLDYYENLTDGVNDDARGYAKAVLTEYAAYLNPTETAMLITDGKEDEE